MNIEVENYVMSRSQLPETGRHIVGHQKDDSLVVYQAYKPAIAEYAVAHQKLGGSDFSYNRMSWIKPNFLWMMYRCGWGEKVNQERILALWIKSSTLEEILENAAFSSFGASGCADHATWERELATKEVRLQWDPDHDPTGQKLARRAIQLGLKGKLLEEFGKNQVELIEDVTDFVTAQKRRLDQNQLDQLEVPIERLWTISNPELRNRIGTDA